MMPSSNIFSIAVREAEKEAEPKYKLKHYKGYQDIKTVTYWNGLHIFGILGICALVISFQTTIPRHNSLLQPDYWFEISFPAGMAIFLMTTTMTMTYIILVGSHWFLSVHLFFNIFILLFCFWLTLYCASYIIWTYFLEYNHPMPFIGPISYYPVHLLSIMVFWILLPMNRKMGNKFKVRQKQFIFYRLLLTIIFLANEILSTIFTALGDTELQFVVAILIQLFKGCGKFVLSKQMHKMVGTENEMAEVTLGISINFTYGLFIATRIAGARTSTAICIVIADLVLQLIMSYKIVHLHKKVVQRRNASNEKEKQKEIRKLVLAEMCEGLVTLAYAICFAMSYYGPNAHLTGNVGIEIWAYKAVDSPAKTLLILFGLFTVDLFTLLINATIIWTCCKINLFQECCIILQKYWYIMAIQLTPAAYLYFLSLDVNLANDWTFEFCWIANDIVTTNNCNEFKLS